MTNLAAGELAMMVARGLAPITAIGFLKQLSDELVDDVYSHIQTPRLRVVLESEESLNPVAFMASKTTYSGYGQFGSDLLYYLGGIIIDEAHRGIGGKLLNSELKSTMATHLGFHTQNLKMLHLGEKLTKYDFNQADIKAGLIGTPMDRKQYKNLPGRGNAVIHSHRYGLSSLYGDSEAFYENDMHIPGLEPQTGDAVVYVGEVKK